MENDIIKTLPWRRYGLIADLANKLKGIPLFGKTKLEKLVYLAQELYGVDAGYIFKLYTYGPFSSQLLQDLDFVQSIKGVVVEDCTMCSCGYDIVPGEQNEWARENASEFLGKEEVKLGIERVVKDFGNLTAKDLELRATIVYVQRYMQNQENALSRDQLVKMVKDIKPGFAEETIREAVMELEGKGFVSVT